MLDDAPASLVDSVERAHGLTGEHSLNQIAGVIVYAVSYSPLTYRMMLQSTTTEAILHPYG